MATKTSLLPEVQDIIVKKLKTDKQKGRKRKNIFVIGLTGTGKSTFINSMIMAINEDGYAEYAYHGYRGQGGDGGHVTAAFRSYDVLDCITPLTENDEKHLFKPYFFDFLGLTNSKDENMKAIVAALMCGTIPENLRIADFLKRSQRAIEEQADDYEKWNSERWADVCIFVMSAQDAEPPTNLMDAVFEAVTRNKIDVPIFLVVTKLDKVSEEERQNLEKFQGNIRIAMQKLAIEEERVFLLTNYLSDNPSKRGEVERNNEKDKILCLIWKRILGREYRRRENIIVKEEPKRNCCIL